MRQFIKVSVVALVVLVGARVGLAQAQPNSALVVAREVALGADHRSGTVKLHNQGEMPQHVGAVRVDVYEGSQLLSSHVEQVPTLRAGESWQVPVRTQADGPTLNRMGVKVVLVLEDGPITFEVGARPSVLAAR